MDQLYSALQKTGEDVLVKERKKKLKTFKGIVINVVLGDL